MNSFGSRSALRVGNKEYEIYRLKALDDNGVSTKHLPYSLRILLENLLRTEDGRNVTEMTSGPWPPGMANRNLTRKSHSLPAGCCCRILPACPRLSTWLPCATP